MNFGFSEEQELLRKTARDFLAEHSPMRRVREILEGPDTHARELWRRIGELGWTGLALPERSGGAGLGMVELCIALEELGRALAPVPFLPTAMAAVAVLEAGDEEQQECWLSPIATGGASAALAIAEEGGREELDDLALRAEREGDGWLLRGSKEFVPDAAAADWIATLARTGRGLGLFAVPAATAGLKLVPLRSLDLLRPLYRVEFDGVRLPADALLGGNPDARAAVERSLDRARVMICAEMLGGAQKCLDDAVAYAKARVQFGKPIGVNQAIKHKCADMLFDVESARSITYYAAWALDHGEAEAPVTAAMAKAWASDAYARAAAENIQIHGGVGFTWEYDCHLYFRRARSDGVWLGDATRNRERVARLLEI